MPLTKARHRMISGASINVLDRGAVGNGTADDTVALQAAINEAYAAGKAVYLPGGHRFRVTAPITLPGAYSAFLTGAGVKVYGDAGGASQILHAFDGRLFTCSATLPSFLYFRDFDIVSTSAKGATSHAFYFANGLTRSTFAALRLGTDGTAANSPAGLFDCAPASTVDTITFHECFLEDIQHKGYGISKGSSVWFEGGRIIGKSRAGGTGIMLYGDNGGVWMDAIDVINIGTGMDVTMTNGSTNRELFMSQACFDSCNIGLRLRDASYCEISGVWAASCNVANIQLDPEYTGIFVAAGGTVFNGGAFNEPGAGDGIVVNNADLVKVDGVTFRNNKGVGLRYANATIAARSTVNGCTFKANGVGLSTGGVIDIESNAFEGNGWPIAIEPGSTPRIRDNRGVNPVGPLAPIPALPASGGSYTYDGPYAVDVYIREGSVTVVWLNGQPVYVSTNVLVRMERGDTIRVDYTAAPSWLWFQR